MNLTLGLHRARRMKAGAEAVVCGDRRLSWGEFVDRIARLAAFLRGAGIRDGERVAILAPNGIPYLEYVFATLWCGGIAVPINSRFALPEMLEQMRDSEPRVLLVDENFAQDADELRAVPSLTATLFIGDGQPPSGLTGYEDAIASSSPLEDAMRTGEDIACIFYTGGTTGRAKGVMLSHANLWANAVVTTGTCGFDETLVHLHAGPLFHLAAAGRVFTTTIVGGRHVVVPRFTPEAALAAIERERVTTATFVPTMLTMILDRPELARFDLSSLRLITYGASPMPEATLRRSIARFPHARFVQSYGMTELSPVATSLLAEDHLPEAPAHRLRSAGRAVVSAEVKIVDQDDRELPTGEIGEIAVRGPMVMKGYWRRPELTAETLRGGWMHTGDSGHLDADGYLYVADRIKDMIITGGENVYSVEVENALAEHPAVRQCAVIGVPDETWGERVHAIVVAARDGAPSPDDLVQHCRSLIAGYKCPRSVEIRTDPLPLSSVNKINKAALRAPFWDNRNRRVN